jgi:hypothetical protein
VQLGRRAIRENREFPVKTLQFADQPAFKDFLDLRDRRGKLLTLQLLDKKLQK